MKRSNAVRLHHPACSGLLLLYHVAHLWPIRTSRHVAIQVRTRRPRIRRSLFITEGRHVTTTERRHWRAIAKFDEIWVPEAPAEWRNWQPGETANSLYALATHALGSTEFLVLQGLCGIDVNRQRAAEFVAEGTAVEPLQEKWRALQNRVQESFSRLPDGALDQERPFRHENMTGREVLLFAARHAAEHKGHAELTLDLIIANQGQQPPLRQPRT